MPSERSTGWLKNRFSENLQKDLHKVHCKVECASIR